MFVFTILIGIGLLLAWFARDLPRTDNLWRTDRAATLTFLAHDGAPLPLQGASGGAPVRLTDLPPYAPQAILAVEDRNFYHHIGVNPISVLRAMMVNVSQGTVRQGGSTITQQLAKNLFLSPDRTVKRKIQELMLAFWLESRFSKDEILTLYLNRVYFGAGAYGIDAASYRYFAKPARMLSVNEAAVLAGLLKAPSKYSPSHNPEDAGSRARLVIEAMVNAGFLSVTEAETALAGPVILAGQSRMRAPYFLDYALAQTRNLTGDIDANLVIRTTLDLKMQSALEAGLKKGLALSRLDPEIEIAAIILDKEGAIRAMAGGRDYAASQFNRASQARRQPGSAFKPFVFLSAIEQGARINDTVLDAPVTVGRWSPDNYKSRFYGEVTLSQALARSLNSAAVRLQEATGRNAVRLTVRRMGVETELNKGPSLALGVDAVSPLMLAGAYAPFSNGGYRVRPYGVVSIAAADGRLAHRREAHFDGVAASAYAIDEVNKMLRAVTQWGTGRAAALERYAAFGKTGTTQKNRDAWFAGHAGGLVAVVWVGRDDNAPMGEITGGTAPAVIWREIMNRALADQPSAPPQFAPPMITPVQPAHDPVADLLSQQGAR